MNPLFRSRSVEGDRSVGCRWPLSMITCKVTLDKIKHSRSIDGIIN